MSEIMKYMRKCSPVGSRVTCSPPPTDTDEDFLVLVDEIDWEDLVGCLEEKGFEMEGSYAPEVGVTPNEGFLSFRKGTTNFILTCSEEFFNLFMAATLEAKRLNLMLKEERVALFQKMLYGVDVAQEELFSMPDLAVENW